MRSFIGDCCETAVIEIEFFIFEEYPVLGRLVSTGFLFDNHLKQDIMEHFLLTIVCVVKDNLCTSSILFNSFEEALYHAQKDVKYYKHLASEYIEKIGINKQVAEIAIKGRYIQKMYRISKMVADRVGCDQIRFTTSPVVDFLPNDKMI